MNVGSLKEHFSSSLGFFYELEISLCVSLELSDLKLTRKEKKLRVLSCRKATSCDDEGCPHSNGLEVFCVEFFLLGVPVRSAHDRLRLGYPSPSSVDVKLAKLYAQCLDRNPRSPLFKSDPNLYRFKSQEVVVLHANVSDAMAAHWRLTLGPMSASGRMLRSALLAMEHSPAEICSSARQKLDLFTRRSLA